MCMMNGMIVEQNGQYYSVYTPNGIMVREKFHMYTCTRHLRRENFMKR